MKGISLLLACLLTMSIQANLISANEELAEQVVTTEEVQDTETQQEPEFVDQVVQKPLELTVQWPEGQPSFWAIQHIAKLKKMDFIRQTNYGSYGNAIDRLAFVSLLVDYYEFTSGTIELAENSPIYVDTDDSYALKATQIGVTNGKGEDEDGNPVFKPDDSLTREEMATMLMRLMDALEKDLQDNEPQVFSDDAKISEWARLAIYKARYYEYLDGVGNNQFAPSQTVTTEQALTMISKILDKETSRNMRYVLLFSMESPKLYKVSKETTVKEDYGQFGEPLYTIYENAYVDIFRKHRDDQERPWGLTANGTWILLEDLILVEEEPVHPLNFSDYKFLTDLIDYRTVPTLKADPFVQVSAEEQPAITYVFYDHKGNRWGTDQNEFVYLEEIPIVEEPVQEAVEEVQPERPVQTYKDYSVTKKIQYKLNELGFDVSVDGGYDLETAASLIVFQAYNNKLNSGSINGYLSSSNVLALEQAVDAGLTYQDIKEEFIDGWTYEKPTITRSSDINGRLGESGYDQLVQVAVRYGQTGLAERNTAIAWAMLVHEEAYVAYGAKASYFYLTYPESGYRSYSQQVNLYEKYGASRAAVPGTSNHGWGLALDMALTSYVRYLINNDPVSLIGFENLMARYGFSPLKYEDGTYWEEWHWDYSLD